MNQVQPVPGAPWEIRQQRKAKPPTVPIPKIMWSDYRAEARKSGFEAYMQKKEEANEVGGLVYFNALLLKGSILANLT